MSEYIEDRIKVLEAKIQELSESNLRAHNKIGKLTGVIPEIPCDKWYMFKDSVRKMNETYELPVARYPVLLPNQAVRTQQFLDIMRKELTEGDDMLHKLQSQFAMPANEELEALTELADWYGDMIVYITSEAIRNGIPLMEVLEIIMASNMTKLGEDGKPIKDENDKFQKGPNFIPPEVEIRELLRSKLISRINNRPDLIIVDDIKG